MFGERGEESIYNLSPYYYHKVSVIKQNGRWFVSFAHKSCSKLPAKSVGVGCRPALLSSDDDRKLLLDDMWPPKWGEKLFPCLSTLSGINNNDPGMSPFLFDSLLDDDGDDDIQGPAYWLTFSSVGGGLRGGGGLHPPLALVSESDSVFIVKWKFLTILLPVLFLIALVISVD